MYVFFDTGNIEFFSRIVHRYCFTVLQCIVDSYRKGKFLHSYGKIDVNYVRKFLRENEKALGFFNCSLFPSVTCKNKECMNLHTAILTTDQLSIFEGAMTNSILACIHREPQQYTTWDRINIQSIIQDYMPKARLDVKIIKIHVTENLSHKEYLHRYIEQTDSLLSKAEGFMYVRAKTHSDYGYFMDHTALPNVTPCDCFQKTATL